MKVMRPTNEWILDSDKIGLFKAVQNQKRHLSHVGDHVSYRIADDDEVL